MTKYNLQEELSLARSKLKAIDIDRLQSTELRKDPREVEKSYIYPGPIPYENEATIEEVFSEENLSLVKGMPLKLYVHLPFCERRCKYCYYETGVGVSSKDVNDYLNLLITELDLVLGKIGENPRTSLIYLGGGTPNYLSAEQTDFLLNALEGRLERLPGSILCIENHPHLVTEEHAEVYSSHGVNRVSLGIQSFSEDVQREIGRHQSKEKAIEVYQLISNYSSVKEINLDMIYGLPGQSIEDWFLTLEQLIELKPEEITVYHFKLHPKSSFFSQQDIRLPSLEEVLIERLISMSIFDKEGYILTRPHHHLLGGKSVVKYERAPAMEIGGAGIGFQLGVGCSAYSHIGEYSYHNLQSRAECCDCVKKGKIPFLRGKRLNDYEKKILFVLGNLCNEGRMSKKHFFRLMPKGEADNDKLRQKIGYLHGLGLVEVTADMISLTLPGILWYEEIARMFYPEKMKEMFMKETGRK